MTEGSIQKAFCVVALCVFGGCATPLDPSEGPRAYMAAVGSGGSKDAPPKGDCRMPAKLGKFEDELDSRSSLDGKDILQSRSVGDGPSWVSTDDRLIYGSTHIDLDPDDAPFKGEYKPGKYAIPPREVKDRPGVPPIELMLWAYDSDDSLMNLQIYSSVSGDLVIESVDAQKKIVRGHFEDVSFKQTKDISDDDLVPNGCQTHLERLDFTIGPRGAD